MESLVIVIEKHEKQPGPAPGVRLMELSVL